MASEQSDRIKLLGLLDNIYRVEEEEFREILQHQFGIMLTWGRHRFTVVPNKIGGEGDVVIGLGDEEGEKDMRIVFDFPPMRILEGREEALYEFKSQDQEYVIRFTSIPRQAGMSCRASDLQG